MATCWSRPWMLRVRALVSVQDLPSLRAIPGTNYLIPPRTSCPARSTTRNPLGIRIKASRLVHPEPPMTESTQRNIRCKICPYLDLVITTSYQERLQLTETYPLRCCPNCPKNLQYRWRSKIQAQAPIESKISCLLKGATSYLKLRTPVCHSSKSRPRRRDIREFLVLTAQWRTTQGPELTHLATSLHQADIR